MKNDIDYPYINRFSGDYMLLPKNEVSEFELHFLGKTFKCLHALVYIQIQIFDPNFQEISTKRQRLNYLLEDKGDAIYPPDFMDVCLGDDYMPKFKLNDGLFMRFKEKGYTVRWHVDSYGFIVQAPKGYYEDLLCSEMQFEETMQLHKAYFEPGIYSYQNPGCYYTKSYTYRRKKNKEVFHE